MSENSKSKKALTSALAIGLAAVMTIGGGTFAYLQGETEEVKNDFKRNKVMVELAETKGPEFSIVPGATDEKDPKVTVDNTVDAYAFVEITDATENLVKYEIADGWTPLEGYDNVYYREVPANADVKEFGVLKNDTVSYDASLTNTDMVDADGNLKENVTLTFKAYAIQKMPFNSAVKAYEAKDAVIVADAAAFETAVTAGGYVALDKNVAIAPEGTGSGLVPQMNVTKDTTLNLSGKTLGVDAAVAAEKLTYTPAIMEVEEGAALTIDGKGTISAEAGNNNSYGINVTGGKVVINDGNFYGAPTAVQVQTGSLEINGGFFDLAPTVKSLVPSLASYVVNCIDSNYKDGSATIVINGGTFVNFDPSANPEGSGTTYVADGYHVESAVQANGDTWYTVVKNA